MSRAEDGRLLQALPGRGVRISGNLTGSSARPASVTLTVSDDLKFSVSDSFVATRRQTLADSHYVEAVRKRSTGLQSLHQRFRQRYRNQNFAVSLAIFAACVILLATLQLARLPKARATYGKQSSAPLKGYNLLCNNSQHQDAEFKRTMPPSARPIPGDYGKNPFEIEHPKPVPLFSQTDDPAILRRHYCVDKIRQRHAQLLGPHLHNSKQSERVLLVGKFPQSRIASTMLHGMD